MEYSQQNQDQSDVKNALQMFFYWWKNHLNIKIGREKIEL